MGFADSRGVRILTEQPINSLFYKFVSVEASIRLTRAKRFATNLRAFGAGTMKPIECFTTLPFDHCTRVLARNQRQARAVMGGSGDHLCQESVRRTNKRQRSDEGWGSANGTWINGSAADLSESSGYPEKFWLGVAQLVCDSAGVHAEFLG